jgi:hypothetical protein
LGSAEKSFQILRQVVPDDAARFVLQVGVGQADSEFSSDFAFCTVTHNGDVGQQGEGEADQMQVGNCGLIRAVLVLAQPQKLFAVLEKDLNLPRTLHVK